MHERTTSHSNGERPKGFPLSRSLIFSGNGERSGNGVEVAEKYQIHPRPSTDGGKLGAGCASVSEWEEANIGSPHQEAGERRTRD